MILFALDCDGTISQGPISIELLKRIEEIGHLIYIVSPSPFCARLDFAHFTPLLPRAIVLENLRSQVVADRYIYVGDTVQDAVSAESANWEFIYAENFVNIIQSVLSEE